VGELFVHRQEKPGAELGLWVHDFQTGAWLPARQACYVENPELVTPMAFGVVAVARPEQAAALGGTTLSFEQIAGRPVRPKGENP
jgi:hypothetical protein